jgi:3-oxoacyl-[acyl-carrier protein] reductase
MNLGIEGRVALVTGASKGIGLGIARTLAAEGARVAITSRDARRIGAAAAAIDARPFVHDFADTHDVARLYAQIEAQHGVPEILVLNSGGPPAGPDPLGFPPEAWERAYHELVLTPIALIERVLPAMRHARWGRIVAVSSTSVREPLENLMLSTVHRSAALAAFKQLARATAGDGVTLNSILPGRIATDRALAVYGSEAAARAGVPAARLGTIDEIGAAAAFLCSEQAGYITGTALLIDGGLTRLT